MAVRPVYWDESVGKLHISSDTLMLFHYIIYHTRHYATSLLFVLERS
jgi:hypothetical protein